MSKSKSILLLITLLVALSVAACRGREQATTPPQPTSPSVIQQPGQPAQPTQPSGQPPAGKPPTQPPAPPPDGKQPTPTPPPPPDLTIAEATVTPTGNQGEVRIHIVARKQGGPISAAFTIRWHPHEKDRTQVGCSQDFYNLNQTEWVVDCTYTYPANQRGEMHWVAVVDAENDVKNEANENNNEKTGTVTIGTSGGPTQPPASGAYDLYVRRMDFTPADMVVGGTITLHLMIATDTYPSGSPMFPASHFRWRQGPTFAWQEGSCPANTQYPTCTPNLTFSYTQPGDYVVEVEADSRKAVAESNENNNTKTWTITVKGQTGGQAPPAPTSCKATQIDTRTIRVEWQFTGQANGFRIYQGKTSLEATVNTSARSWTIADLPPNVQHHFDVRAYNASGESRADACSVDVTRR